jgi:transcriptional enhancer factor
MLDVVTLSSVPSVGKVLMKWCRFCVAVSSLAAGKISSPWTPASSGPPADTNGSGSDSKNLDVGDEVSDEVTCEQFIIIYFCIIYWR